MRPGFVPTLSFGVDITIKKTTKEKKWFVDEEETNQYCQAIFNHQ